MAIYAIGDVQGCYTELRRLIDRLHFDPAHDELWFVGDLVNRGPASLQTLRFVQALGESAVVVLGNHDLHLLASHAGVRPPDEALQPILDAPDVDDLLTWLRTRPLAVYRPEINTLMVHAGVYRDWDPLMTVKLAREVENTLRSDSSAGFFAKMYGTEPSRWSPTLTGTDRQRLIINCLTRMRYCYPDGRLDFEQKGPPGTQPPPLVPWFELPNRAAASVRIVSGHWSSLDLVTQADFIMLDTGCVWGRQLTAARLDGPMQITQVEATGPSS